MGNFRVFFIFISLCFCSEGFAVQPIIPCEMNRDDQRAGNVAICMVFQNEARFIQEWIEYHKAIGVTHFYLYNNASTDNIISILEPYILSGEIELFNLPQKTSTITEHNRLQRAVYDHAVKCSKNYNEWLAIIDSDEFICMPHQNDLNQFLEPYAYAGGLVLNWVMYGSSSVEEVPPNELQIDHFVYRAPDDWYENFKVKTIVRPTCVKSAGIHVSSYRSGYRGVFANHEKFSRKHKFDIPPINDIRINHYWWRDEKYFREVKLPRRSGWMTFYTDAEINERRQMYNSVYDPSIVPFADIIRENILLINQE